LNTPILELSMDGLVHGRASKSAIVKIAVAGHTAQKMTGDPLDLASGAEVDFQRVGDLLKEMFSDPSDRRIYKGVSLLKCETALKRHWPAVEALAKALLERRHLTGEHVLKVVKRGPI